MKADYAPRSLSTPSSNRIVKLQALTVDGVLRVKSHNQRLKIPHAKPVDNIFSDVAVFPSADIERLAELDMHIFKISVKNRSMYCLKTVPPTGNNEGFIREASILQLCSHSNIIHLVDLMLNGDAKMKGMIVDWMENARLLSDLPYISAHEREKWTRQIKDSIEYIHQKGLVLGDAKAGNVLIDMDGNATLIDFGIGYIQDWIDMTHHDIVYDDFQGLERVISFMREKITYINKI